MEAGLRLRQAMLINGILYNSEAWHNVNDKDVNILEKVDEALLRGLLQAHPKIPLEALYLETKCIPIRYILASRRNVLRFEIQLCFWSIFQPSSSLPPRNDALIHVKIP